MQIVFAVRAHAPSSSRLYLRKSFFSTRIRMVARNPVSSSTVTQLLMMLNQWICVARVQHLSAIEPHRTNQ